MVGHTTGSCTCLVLLQVLAEQARRVGISIEAENAVEQSAARAAVSRKKQDAGYSLEISSIHRRVKQMMKSRTAEAEPVSRSASYQALPEAEPDLPPGWESRLDDASGPTSCKHMSHIRLVWSMAHISL